MPAQIAVAVAGGRQLPQPRRAICSNRGGRHVSAQVAVVVAGGICLGSGGRQLPQPRRAPFAFAFACAKGTWEAFRHVYVMTLITVQRWPVGPPRRRKRQPEGTWSARETFRYVYVMTLNTFQSLPAGPPRGRKRLPEAAWSARGALRQVRFGGKITIPA